MADATAAAAHRLDPERLGNYLDRLSRAAHAVCGRREDADDLVQETYAQVLARPRWLRRDDDFGYLLGVLRNTHVSRLRTHDRRPSEVSLDLEPEAADVAGLTYREAGDALGVREATVTTRLHRARRRVAAEIGRDQLSAA